MNRIRIGINRDIPVSKHILVSIALVFVMVLSGLVVFAANDTNVVTIDSLINDSMLDVNNIDWNYANAVRVPENPEWSTLLQSNRPLDVYEVYKEDFSKTFFESRLRPYTATYYTPDVALDASYRYVENAGKRSVLMETNGLAGGVYDYIEFAGLQFTDGASYSVSVEYTVTTPNRLFKMGFGPNASSPYFMDLSGLVLGQKNTSSGTFSTSGLGADIHSNLILMVAGGDAPSSIQIDSITITRLPSKPKAMNAAISGTIAVGQTLSLTYDYYQDYGIAEGSSEIVWFTATDNIGKNMTLIQSSKGQRSLSITNSMSGLFIGALVTTKTVNPADNGIGDSQIVVTRSTVGSALYYGPYAIDTPGKPFTEDFESISNAGNISFAPENSVLSYITDESGVSLSGKSLYIKSPGGMKGGILKDVTFTGGKNYIVSFQYRFIGLAPSNLQIQFRSPSNGYSADIYQVLSNPKTGVEGTFTSKLFKLGAIDDYYLQLFDAYGPYSVVIDNLKIECFDPVVVVPGPPETTSDASTLEDLATVGVPFTENFTKNAIGSLWSYDMSHFGVVEDTQAIAGKSIMQSFTGATNGSVYAFGTKGKLAAGAKYRITASYKYLTNTAPSGMYFAFTRDGSANEKALRIDFTGKQKNTVYTFTGDYILENFADYYLVWFNLNGNDGSAIVIDTLIIERIYLPPSASPETPSDASTLADLATVGKPFVENFTKNAIGSLWSYDMSHFTIVEDTQAIAGKSIKNDYTNASFGGIYFFGTKGKLTAGAKYKITASYKVLSDKMPTGFYFGFTRDGGANQKNIQVDFTNKVKNTNYTFTGEYTLDSFSDYYSLWFNLNGKDGSIIVVDTYTIERIA